jgi:hypothetical protein
MSDFSDEGVLSLRCRDFNHLHRLRGVIEEFIMNFKNKVFRGNLFLKNASAMPSLLTAFVLCLTPLVCLTLLSCKEPEARGKTAEPQGSGYGRIAVILSTEQKSARTVLPSLVFDKYVYTFTKLVSDTSEAVSDTSFSEPDSNGFFMLAVGTYTVAVSAFIGKAEPYTLAAAGVSEPFSVNAGNNDPVSVYLNSSASSELGEFSYIITYPQDAWGEISLLKYPGMDEVGLSPSHVCDENGISETVELEAGSYLLTVLVSLNGRYAGVTEAVHIFPSITTLYDKDFIDEDFHAEPPTEHQISGSIKIEYYWVDQHDNLIKTSDVTSDNGTVRIALNETLAITAQGTGYSNQQWYLNGISAGQSGNTYLFTGTTAGNHTIGLFVEKNGKLYNTNIAVIVEGTAEPVTRTITVDMYDSTGDGWGGSGALRIVVNGVEIANNVKVSGLGSVNIPKNQRNANTYAFTAKTGDIVQFYWVAGSSQNDNSFIVYYDDKPPNPAFTADNKGSSNWSGSNALLFRVRASAPAGLTGVTDGALLGEFTVK